MIILRCQRGWKICQSKASKMTSNLSNITVFKYPQPDLTGKMGAGSKKKWMLFYTHARLKDNTTAVFNKLYQQ